MLHLLKRKSMPISPHVIVGNRPRPSASQVADSERSLDIVASCISSRGPTGISSRGAAGVCGWYPYSVQKVAQPNDRTNWRVRGAKEKTSNPCCFARRKSKPEAKGRKTRYKPINTSPGQRVDGRLNTHNGQERRK